MHRTRRVHFVAENCVVQCIIDINDNKPSTLNDTNFLLLCVWAVYSIFCLVKITNANRCSGGGRLTLFVYKVYLLL